MKRSVLMKLTACCMTGAMVLGSTGVVTMASGLDSALAGMGAEIADSQQQKEVVKVAPTGYDTVAIAQVNVGKSVSVILKLSYAVFLPSFFT